MISNIRITTARLVALLVLAALLGAGVQAAMAAEQTLTMSMGKLGDIGTDPTVDSTISPGIGGAQDYHYYTHYSPLIVLDKDDNIVPWMAESYDVSDDYRTITDHAAESHSSREISADLRICARSLVPISLP